MPAARRRPESDLPAGRAQLFHALSDETRLGILAMLRGGERCVCDLQDDLDAAQSRLSFHLRKLKEAGVVSDRRDGRWVYYSLVPEALDDMRSFLGEMKPREGWLPVIRQSDCCE
jgi:ArsR family transcriptional regulator